MSIPVPILDTHIHLYPLAEAPTLAWNHPAHPLWGQRSVAEYKAATASSHDLLAGFVFLETDRANDEADPTPAGGWRHPLAEVSFLARIAAGAPRADEGHVAGDAALCKGVVPWAPVPAGAAVLEQYLAGVREAWEREAGAATWRTVKGFRYLLQDKPDGVMLQDGFVEGVRLLGRKGFVFDVGVDLHRRGRVQLEEAVELVERAHRGVEDKDKTVFILSEWVEDEGTRVESLTNVLGPRPSLQTGPHNPQHKRSKLHRLAHCNVHPLQGRQRLHASLFHRARVGPHLFPIFTPETVQSPILTPHLGNSRDASPKWRLRSPPHRPTRSSTPSPPGSL